MMGGGRKYGRTLRLVLLLLLLLSPSIVFGAYYLSTSLPSSTGSKHVSLTTSDPSGWSVNFTLRHPAYFATGQQIPVDVIMKLGVTNPNITLGVSYAGVEFRSPLRINSTSGVVTQWAVLSSSLGPVKQNYTSPSVLTKTYSLVGTYPPTTSLFDLFVPTNRVAINGVANLTVYQASGNTTSATPLPISILDSQIFYQTQLSTIISPSSWLVYQLLIALVVSAVYISTRPPSASRVDKTYASRLESYKLERSLLELEELRKSGKVNENTYNELKQSYEKELARVRTKDRMTSTG